MELEEINAVAKRICGDLAVFAADDLAQSGSAECIDDTELAADGCIFDIDEIGGRIREKANRRSVFGLAADADESRLVELEDESVA